MLSFFPFNFSFSYCPFWQLWNKQCSQYGNVNISINKWQNNVFFSQSTPLLSIPSSSLHLPLYYSPIWQRWQKQCPQYGKSSSRRSCRLCLDTLSRFICVPQRTRDKRICISPPTPYKWFKMTKISDAAARSCCHDTRVWGKGTKLLPQSEHCFISGLPERTIIDGKTEGKEKKVR